MPYFVINHTLLQENGQVVYTYCDRLGHRLSFDVTFQPVDGFQLHPKCLNRCLEFVDRIELVLRSVILYDENQLLWRYVINVMNFFDNK